MKILEKNQDEINFLGSSQKELLSLNKKYGWSLNDKELLMVKDYFKILKRNPTRAEIETVAQTWSEHCKHKTFSGPVDFIWKDINGRVKLSKKFKNLFKETIVYTTKKLNKKYCLSVFEDNAGIIELYDKSDWGVCFKVETHNHPCALEPYGGAETGVGGVIRDILGVGLGAKPVIDTDVFCFAYNDRKYEIPSGFLSPHKIISGVVSGVRDYGNKMGIPTANGSVYFDDDYLFNPLVFVGSVGLIKKDRINKTVEPGSLIFVLGGPTGRDGIGGATFSSADIDEETSSSHVQIGHAINEKKVLDVLLKARDLDLYTAVTDCGAGGFSSAVGELASDCGAVVELKNVLLKDKNITPWEIWLSESQERMVLAVKKESVAKLKRICEIEECQYYIIGEFTDDKKLRVSYDDKLIIDIDMSFLHSGLPRIEKKAVYKERRFNKALSLKNINFLEIFKRVISDLNVCSRRSIIEQYDHEVMGQTVLKPFCSKNESTPSDACVIWPYNVIGDFNDYRGFAISSAINPAISKISPYDMSFYVLDEAVRNLCCVGADITRAALLDNFCSANPNISEVMGDFTAAALGIKNAALDMELPFISGKDSFYNQTVITGKNYKIPVTLLISAVAPVDDVRMVVSSDFKEEGNPVYVAGEFMKGFGGSVYSRISGEKNNYISQLNLRKNRKIYLRIVDAIRKNYILASHDVSDGGLLSALFEMSLGGYGIDADISKACKKYGVSDVEAAFGECGSRIILEVNKKFDSEFIKLMKGLPVIKLGITSDENSFIIKNDDDVLINENPAVLKRLWEREILK